MKKLEERRGIAIELTRSGEERREFLRDRDIGERTGVYKVLVERDKKIVRKMKDD